MIIDIIFAIAIVISVFKGYSKGLIIAAFSIIGFIVGLAAALKLSATVATILSENLNTNGKWLPFASFLLVMILVMFLIRIGAKFIQKSFEVLLLGWVNRIGGILFYALLYSIILSIFIFYAEQLKIISVNNIASSITYPYIKPLGPMVINGMGIFIPWFKNMFGVLEQFFGKLA